MRSIALRASCAVIGVLAGANGAWAQAAPSPAPGDAASASDRPGDSYHREPGREIVVTGVLPTERQDMLSGVAILQGAELTQKLRPSIGETLSRTAGVSATSFGPSASRPVLRGLQGERVRVLTDGIGSIDVSNTSVDHATVVNPLLAERIEVLRGPQSLLYGSSAIGGVVNVLDKRIPTAVPDEPFHLGAIATYGSAANERSAAGSLDVPLASHWVIHADGSYLKSDDIRIGGHALTPALRAQALASSLVPPDPEEEEPIDFAANAAVKGKLPNTASKTWTAGAGIAYIADGGSLGLAYSHYDSLYGVPIRFATEPGQEQEGPRLSLLQNRLDARAEVDTGGGVLQSVRMRLGYANYRHFELEEDGAVGTAFYNKGMEGRIELTQAKRGAWSGATGGQFYVRDFNVVGEEAFLPKNSTEQWGLFTLQQLDYGALKLEAGARFEHTSLSSSPTGDQPQFFSGKRGFDAFSGSLGASYGFGDGWRLGLNVSRTERAPAGEELFANGPHAGTEAFEVGNPDFQLEKAWSVEAILRGHGPGYTLEASVYHTWFSNFIYEDRTGEDEDGLPVYLFRQAGARYYGFELQGSLTLARIGDLDLVADGLADYTHARIDGAGPAPRIPPLRLLGGLGVNSRKIDVRGEVEWVDDQTRISAFEAPTNGYTMVNAEVNFRPWGNERPLSFALSANNILDVDARRHASFLKDYAPLAGRDIRVSARVNF
ncbi:TonB-dependent receptor [Novosphingobium album (ex Liu et al. 2023)]|uniref:TonB-dependent receptor n=1 Tax=Novosphingobium album (ex Liu et al. 2023) TaxID=3031130 RepID=A0ABT5WJX0_9SPHN|nr:TonB-dependent receptor [Novosphingobium album (ex Liu et al. 2023)]MDE8650340.1 TonB-dependent receptor [Novosphingobium album (ex Liu et al. 2023)]